MSYCLYAIRFENGKLYLGMTMKGVSFRFHAHVKAAERGSELLVHRAMRKHKHQVQVLCIGDKDYISQLEVEAIRVFRTRNIKFGYNTAVGGELGAMAGRSHTAKSRVKMGISQKTRVRTPEEIAKMAETLKGRVFTEEHRQKLSLKGKGKPKSPETKLRVSEGLKRHFAVTPQPSRPCSAEKAAKISASLKGRKTGRRYEMTPEIREKMSAAKRGKQATEKQLLALEKGRTTMRHGRKQELAA